MVEVLSLGCFSDVDVYIFYCFDFGFFPLSLFFGVNLYRIYCVDFGVDISGRSFLIVLMWWVFLVGILSLVFKFLFVRVIIMMMFFMRMVVVVCLGVLCFRLGLGMVIMIVVFMMVCCIVVLEFSVCCFCR